MGSSYVELKEVENISQSESPQCQPNVIFAGGGNNFHIFLNYHSLQVLIIGLQRRSLQNGGCCNWLFQGSF